MLLNKCESEFSKCASELSTAVLAIKNEGNFGNLPSCIGYVCDLEIYLKLLQTLWRRYLEEGKKQQFLEGLETIVASIVKMASMAHLLCNGGEMAENIQYVCKKANALECAFRKIGNKENQCSESQLVLF